MYNPESISTSAAQSTQKKAQMPGQNELLSSISIPPKLPSD